LKGLKWLREILKLLQQAEGHLNRFNRPQVEGVEEVEVI
jgi:hypothetical protein